MMDIYNILKSTCKRRDKLMNIANDIDLEIDGIYKIILGDDYSDKKGEALFNFCEGKITRRQLTNIMK